MPRGFKFRLTDVFKNKLKNLKNIPKKINSIIQDRTIKESEEVINDFKKAVKKDNIGLKRLKQKTISVKERKGFSNPGKPLYGLGTGSQRSYMNMMTKKKIKYGVMIEPANISHWTGNVTLKKLFRIHESKEARNKIPRRPVMEKILNLRKAKKKKFNFVVDSGFDVIVSKK